MNVSKQRIFFWLIWLLVVLQFQDGYFTYLGVNQFGILIEANPLIRYLLMQFGNPLGLIIPKAIGLFFIYIIYKSRKAHLSLSLAITVILNILYTYAFLSWCLVLFG